MIDLKKHPVLYVDDEKSNQTVFLRNFEDKYRIVIASNGEEALRELAVEQPAVVVSDQRMPGMSGNDLLAGVKEMYPETQRVVVTAFSDLQPVLDAINRGMVARYLIKPWSVRELDAVLAWAVETFNLTASNKALQMQLLLNERLVTAGMLVSGVAHDMANFITHFKLDAEQLLFHAATANEVRKALEGAEASLPSADLKRRLLSLLEEVGPIGGSVLQGTQQFAEMLKAIGAQARPLSEEDAHSDPESSMRYAAELARHEIVVRGGGLQLRPISARSGEVRMSASALTQTLVNLLINAAHALQPETGRRGEVSLVASSKSGGVEILVTDNGRGMSEEVRKRATEAFFTTKPPGQGTGLGLAMCAEAIQKALGELEIESTEGKGTTVRIWLPFIPRDIV